MHYLPVRVLTCFVYLTAVGFAQTAVSSSGGATQSSQRAVDAPQLSPLVQLPHPGLYAMSFLPISEGSESMAFVISPDGQLGTIPMRQVGAAYRTGYRPFTAADLVAIASSVADEEKNTQRRLKELAQDYDALVARYNRLAAINSAPAVQPQPAVQAQPGVDERQAMRMMLFQSLLGRALPAPATRVQVQQQTVDCTKYPALCVNH
jgi:hypothetical protein